MRTYKWSLGLECRRVGLAALAALIWPGLASADSIVVNIHDGQPFNPLYNQPMSQVAGNFLPGLEATSGFRLNRIWLYHGGADYAASGVPYEIHLVVRRIYAGGGEEIFPLTHYSRESTCNFCWEELPLYQWFPLVLNANNSLGVFFRPRGGYSADRIPRTWVDRFVNYEHAAASLHYSDPVEYTDPAYFSDYGIGEVMIGVELEGDIIVPTGETSFSAIKSLY